MTSNKLTKTRAAMHSARGAKNRAVRRYQELRVALDKLICAVERAHDEIFEQCASNPIYNAWGSPVSVLRLNEAMMTANDIRREIGAPAPAPTIDAQQPETVEDCVKRAFDTGTQGFIREMANIGVNVVVQTSSTSIPQDADRYFPFEYEVWQDDMVVASSSGHRHDAIRGILHYAAQYQQEGPVRIFEVRRQLCSADELAFALNGLTEAETTASASVAGLMRGK